jgi:hypothetical protein
VLTANVVATIASDGTPAGTTVAEWVAKARQESSFDESVDNGICCKGLWQINYKAHPQYDRGKLGDPFYNWKAAKELYAGAGWRPWAASGGKPTPTAEDRAAAAAPAPVKGWGLDSLLDIAGSALPDPLEGVAQALRDAVEVVIAAGEWIANPRNMGRIALVVAGGLVAVKAADIVSRPYLESKIGAVVGGATPAKAVASAAAKGASK